MNASTDHITPADIITSMQAALDSAEGSYATRVRLLKPFSFANQSFDWSTVLADSAIFLERFSELHRQAVEEERYRGLRMKIRWKLADWRKELIDGLDIVDTVAYWKARIKALIDLFELFNAERPPVQQQLQLDIGFDIAELRIEFNAIITSP